MGYALGLAQLGSKHPNAKPWKGEGAGVLEVVEDHRGDTYRAIYTVRFVVYVLHALPEEIEIRNQDASRGREASQRALKRAQQDYESRGTS